MNCRATKHSVGLNMCHSLAVSAIEVGICARILYIRDIDASPILV